MTTEEAIDYNKNLRMYMRLSDKKQPCKFLKENYIALDMAIKALEQGDVLDKIRAEITEERKVENIPEDVEMWDYIRALDRTLSIIDKYKGQNKE